MNRWMKGAAALTAVLWLGGCSLLKVSVSTGDPLSKEQMDVRTMTRGFYYDMAGEVARAADSIVSLSPDLGVRVAAVRWKPRRPIRCSSGRRAPWPGRRRRGSTGGSGVWPGRCCRRIAVR